MAHSFSCFLYLDTNILSEIAKNNCIWGRLHDYLIASDLTLAISGGQIAELVDASRLHEKLAELFLTLPSAVIKEQAVVLAEEVSAHPKDRTNRLLKYPLNAMRLEHDGQQKLVEFLSSPALAGAAAAQRQAAEHLLEKHREMKLNFPPKESGKYTIGQGSEFADNITMQALGYDHRRFLLTFAQDVTRLRLETFRSLRLQALVSFYKNYLGGREPHKLSTSETRHTSTRSRIVPLPLWNEI